VRRHFISRDLSFINRVSLKEYVQNTQHPFTAEFSPRTLKFDVAARSKEKVCGPELAGIVGSNPTRGMDVCLLYNVYVIR
jgi:hypothetical protein